MVPSVPLSDGARINPVGVLDYRSGKSKQERYPLKLLLRGLNIRLTDQMEENVTKYLEDPVRVRRELQNAQRTDLSSAQIQAAIHIMLTDTSRMRAAGAEASSVAERVQSQGSTEQARKKPRNG